VQFIDPPPTLFIFPALPVGCATVRFLLYGIDLFLNEFGQFMPDSLRVS
jgi:hypothetical protein